MPCKEDNHLIPVLYFSGEFCKAFLNLGFRDVPSQKRQVIFVETVPRLEHSCELNGIFPHAREILGAKRIVFAAPNE